MHNWWLFIIVQLKALCFQISQLKTILQLSLLLSMNIDQIAGVAFMLKLILRKKKEKKKKSKKWVKGETYGKLYILFYVWKAIYPILFRSLYVWWMFMVHFKAKNIHGIPWILCTFH